MKKYRFLFFLVPGIITGWMLAFFKVQNEVPLIGIMVGCGLAVGFHMLQWLVENE